MAPERNSRNSKSKQRFLGIVATCIMALLTFMAATSSLWANNKDTGHHTQELNHPLPAIITYNDNVFTAPATALAGRAILPNKVEMVSKYHSSFRRRLPPEYVTL